MTLVNYRCQKCGMFYVHGLPDDERQHRNHHRRWAAVAEPKPNPAIRKQQMIADGLIAVDRHSPTWLNKAVYERARLFHYDFPLWNEYGPSDGPNKSRAFLFIADDRVTLAGACAFEWMDRENAPHGWTMMWVWLAPAYRRHGILTRHWYTFRDMFGVGFHLEKPLSDAMAAFVRKHSHVELNKVQTIQPEHSGQPLMQP